MTTMLSLDNQKKGQKHVKSTALMYILYINIPAQTGKSTQGVPSHPPKEMLM